MRMLIVAALALPFGAGAQDMSVARSLAATCANCHGPQGHSATSTVASLAGRPKGEIVAAMQAFKSGAKPATVMHQLSKGYTDEQIEMMAGFFAAQKK
ncbi:MAG TPA: cytochrome C [Burkholderiales bacterium]|nr:cytochrome C [Burkholderiales bacterium]